MFCICTSEHLFYPFLWGGAKLESGMQSEDRAHKIQYIIRTVQEVSYEVFQ